MNQRNESDIITYGQMSYYLGNYTVMAISIHPKNTFTN